MLFIILAGVLVTANTFVFRDVFDEGVRSAAKVRHTATTTATRGATHIMIVTRMGTIEGNMVIVVMCVSGGKGEGRGECEA